MKNSDRLAFNRAAENELSRRRAASLRIENARRENVRNNYPEIEAIRREMLEIGFDLGDKLMREPASEAELVELGNSLLEKKKAELSAALINRGLPADYLEPVYACPVCRDTGRTEDGVCACLRQLIIEDMFSGSGLNPGETFESFRHDLISDPRESKAMERIYAYCVGYADSFPNNEQPGLLLMGAPGVGKTFLLNSIGGRVLKRGHSVLRLTANKLVSSVLDSIRDTSLPRPDFISPELLIIDDLGTEPMIANVTIESILSILSERQDLNKATLFATNKDIEALAEEYGERIISRLVSPRSVKVIKLTTPSIRVMKF
ncbi:MAG: ATP-binding protein [Clostridia bacterium]|nr:ATP-binding protein [Clostridia bacterium]